MCSYASEGGLRVCGGFPGEAQGEVVFSMWVGMPEWEPESESGSESGIDSSSSEDKRNVRGDLSGDLFSIVGFSSSSEVKNSNVL